MEEIRLNPDSWAGFSAFEQNKVQFGDLYRIKGLILRPEVFFETQKWVARLLALV